MRTWFSIGAVVLGLLLMAACAPKAQAPAPQAALPAPKAAVAAPAPVAAAPAKAVAWEEKLEQVLARAKQEGRVVLYTTAGAEPRAAIATAFRGKYEIPVETVAGTTGEINEKLLSERRAGLYLVDIYLGGAIGLVLLKPAGALDPLEPILILPELSDAAVIEKTWWGGKLLWVDPDHKILAILAFPQDWAVINTELVKPEEMTSFKDLLNPKWKGKILMHDPTMPGAGGKLFSVSATQLTGMDYWREFAKQEPVFLRDHRQMAEWVARGKYALAIAPKPDIVQGFIKAGSPLMFRSPKEGVGLVTGTGGLGLVNRAPHPNAANLFINWLLSKEGVTLFSKAYGAQSARLDVPTDFLPAERLRAPQTKYIWSEAEELLTKEPELYKVAREIFAPYLTR